MHHFSYSFFSLQIDNVYESGGLQNMHGDGDGVEYVIKE